MDSDQPFVFDSVEFQKQKAMTRFNRFRKIAKLLQFLEVLLALMLISWSSTLLPRAVKFSGDFFFEIAGYLYSPHVVFLIGNVIIFALFVLCRENDGGEHRSLSTTGDIYDDYIRHSEVQRRKVAAAPDVGDDSSPELEMKVMTEQSSATDGNDEVEEKRIIHFGTNLKAEAGECDAVATAIETATKNIQKFQRTQSAKPKRDILMKPQVEFRRSETVKVGRRSERQVTTSFDSVDTLSNEEFKLTIDAFIEKHQQFLKDQKLAEYQELK